MNDSLDMIISSLANLFAVTAVTEFALNWLVQSTLLIAAGLLLARMLQAKGSATQSLIYRTTLVAVLVCPLATWTLSQLGASGWSIRLPNYPSQSIQEVADADTTPDLESSATPAAAEPQALSVDESPISLPNDQLNEFPFQNQPLPAATDFDQSLAVDDSPNRELSEPNEPAEQHVVAASTMATSDGPSTKSFNWLGVLTLCISIGWITTSAVFLTRLIAAWWRLSRLVQRARPAEAATRQLCEELAAPIGVNVPEILRNPFLASPCLTGLGLTRRSSILLPEDDSHLPMRDVLVHELAHLRRHDVHWNLFRQVATAIYFFQPLLWVLSRRIEITAEEVCDDFVVQFGGDRERYATQLVDIAELSTDVSAAAVATAGVGIVALRSMLARRVERIMDGSRELSTRVGGLLLLLVLTVGLVGTSVVGLVGLNNAPTLAEATVAETAVETDESETNKPDSQSPSEPMVDGKRRTEPAKSVKYTGQVLDPDGKPVADASIYHIYYTSMATGLLEPTWKPVATTGGDGKFEFEYAADEFEGSPEAAKYGVIVATKEGFGFGKASGDELSKDGQPIEPIRLSKDHSIRGRIIDIEGEPVAGARLVLVQVFGMKDKWSEGVKKPDADFYSMRNNWTTFNINAPQVRSIVTPAITNAEGKFELRGLGKGRLGQFILSGPGIESVKIYARSEAGATIMLPNEKRNKDRTDTYYPSEFEYISGPSVPVTGVVRASDTGEPISGVTVKSQSIHGNPLTGWSSDFIRAVSDTDGRYRLRGLPIGKDNVIAAMGPAADESTNSPAYLSLEARVSTEAASEEVERDLELVRGSWLHGRITDKSTGKGLPGRLRYFSKPSKPYGRGIGFVDERDRLISDDDGRFRIAVPRGEGYITFMPNDHQSYPRATEIQNLDGTTTVAGNMIGNFLIPRNFHLVAEYEADADDCERNLAIGKGLTRKGKVIGPDKQPATGFRYLSRKAQFGRWELSTSNEFDLEDYDPDVQRDVYFIHAAKNLAGHSIATGPTDEPLVVELMEAGTVTGRLVDEDGEPLPNRRLMRWSPPMSGLTETGNVKTSPSLPYNARYDHGINETDEDGNFTLTCLLPDTEYRVQVLPQKPPEFVKSLGIVIKVKAGETTDLGDISIAEADAYLDQAATDQKTEALPKPVEVTERKTTPTQKLEYSGQVLDPDGKPVAGANIYHVYYMPKPMGLFEPTSKPVTTSGDDGRFRFEFTRDGSLRSSNAAKYGTAFATKKGFGFGIAHRENTAQKPEDVLSLANRSKDIHLLKDHPIRGRIVNIDGEPVAGARLILTRLSITANNDLGSWNEAAKEPNADFYSVLKNDFQYLA